MKQAWLRLSPRKSFVLSLIIHIIICLLFFLRIIQEKKRPVPKQNEHRAPIRFAQEPTSHQPPQLIQRSDFTQDAPPPSSTVQPHQKSSEQIVSQPAPTQTSEQAPRAWNKEKARAQWRKKLPPAESAKQASQSHFNNEFSFYESRYHGHDPLAPQQLTLQQKIDKAWKEDRSSNYQYTIARAICYELNKQNIIDYPQALPQAIYLSVTLDSQGNLFEAFVDRRGLSTSLHQILYQALCYGSPYPAVPASLLEGDTSFTLRFTIHADHQEGPSPSQKIPIRFFIRN